MAWFFSRWRPLVVAFPNKGRPFGQTDVCGDKKSGTNPDSPDLSHLVVCTLQLSNHILMDLINYQDTIQSFFAGFP
jgi:hypothetical protein